MAETLSSWGVLGKREQRRRSRQGREKRSATGLPAGFRALRFEPMEERALLSASTGIQTDHIALHLGAATPICGPVEQIAPLASTPPSSAKTPHQIRMAYGLEDAAGNPLVKLGGIVGDGTGQTIAIVDAYDDPDLVSSTSANFNTSDLHVFDAYWGLADPPNFLKLDQNGGTSYPSAPTGSNATWATEEALDVEWAHVMAPKANIVLFEAVDASGNLYTAVNEARTWAGVAGVAPVSVVTMSWGGSDGYESLYDSYFTTPSGHTGVTFLASTGDSGYPGGYPAYSSNVVAVGGTSLYLNSDNSWNSETGWNWQSYNGTYAGTGGGQSSVEATPSYQTSFGISGGREIPDVSFDADPNTGVAMLDSYYYGGWVQMGGTSLSSPCFAGLIAVADQLRVSQNLSTLNSPSNSTQTQTLFYALAGSPSNYNPAGDYHDITSGSNNGESAAAGYDMVTGIGSPVANKLLPDLVPARLAGTVAFSSSQYQLGTSAVITVRDSSLNGNPSCSVTATSSAGDSETVSLAAQGDGVFTGSIVVSGGAVVLGDGVLQAVAGGTITATYNDANDGTGHTAVVTAQATVMAPLAVTTSTPLPAAIATQPYSVTLAATGGVGGYTWSTAVGNYTESNPGTGWLGNETITENWQSASGTWSLALPWAFPFYGTNYSSVYVCSNGYLDFTSSAASTANSDAALESAVRIAPLWDNITTNFSSGNIYVTSNSSYVAVRWAARTSSGRYTVDVEAVLYPNGDIKFNYGPTAMSHLTPTAGVSAGDGIHYTLSTYDNASSIVANVSTLMTHYNPLPPGLSLSSAGVLSGTPTTAGAFNFPVTVTDSASPKDTATQSFLLNVAQDGLAITATDAVQVQGTSGTTPFTFTVTRTGLTTATTTVNYAVSGSGTNPANVADFGGTFPSGTLTFAPGQTSQLLTVNVSGSLLVEPAEGFTVTLSGASADAIITTPSATGTILNNNVATIAGRYVFYNNSYFDGNNPAANAQDDNAIATDKTALMPGVKASFANYTSYSKGINGVMVDITGVTGPITAADFQFKVGNTIDPSTWSANVPVPTVAWRVLPDGITTRATLIWPDNAIQKEWLQVKVLVTADTGLAAPDVFYFGNAIGESGDSAANAWVNATDAVAAGDHVQIAPKVGVTNLYDYNRDGMVNATDAVLAGNNVAIGGAALQLITPTDNQRSVQLLMAALGQSAKTAAAPGVAAADPLAKLAWLYEEPAAAPAKPQAPPAAASLPAAADALFRALAQPMNL